MDDNESGKLSLITEEKTGDVKELWTSGPNQRVAGPKDRWSPRTEISGDWPQLFYHA